MLLARYARKIRAIGLCVRVCVYMCVVLVVVVVVLTQSPFVPKNQKNLKKSKKYES